MLVWPDGTVTGSVNVAELEEIRAALSSKGGMKHPDDGPIEHVSQLVKGKSHAVIAEPAAPTAVEAIAATDADADDAARAASQVDLPEVLDKASGKKAGK